MADLTEAEYASLAHFRYLLRQYLAFSERAATAAGLEPRQYQLLLALRGRAASDVGLSVGELADALQVRHHSAVGLIDRTAARGLVERRADPADGRRVFVLLTDLGCAALAELAVLHRDELRRVAPALLESVGDVLGSRKPMER